MFSFFKKKPKMPAISDKVWMSSQAKSTGFAIELKSLLAQNKQVCIFYYFEDTLKQLQATLAAHNLSLVELERSQSSTSLIAIQAIELERSIRLQNSLKEYLNKENCVLIFAEHYPLLDKEQAALERIASLSDSNLKVSFYVSLDEPIMKLFGSTNIVELMKKLGMKDDESIEHNMISSALCNAQKKLASKAQTDTKSDSAEEWFKRNIKS